jgi:hypothetical protein
VNNPRYGTNNDSTCGGRDSGQTSSFTSGPRRGTPGLGRNGMPNDVCKWPDSMLPSSTRPGPGGFNRRKGDEASFAGFSSGLNNAQPRMSDGTGGFN